MTDLAFRQVDVGDYVVYATTAGHSASFRFGKVLVSYPGQIVCRSVRPQRDLVHNTLFRLQKDTIVSSYWHVLRVEKDILPAEVQELLG